ncbi:MAG: hypothetical protein QF412_07990 [Planctomycetota bacterium]|jgi:hypothetical protein|nr:hypothetical protein [Planctomycetota bacterium]
MKKIGMPKDEPRARRGRLMARDGRACYRTPALLAEPAFPANRVDGQFHASGGRP